MVERSAYARAGVDRSKISLFKKEMGQVARDTATFPNRRGVRVDQNIVRPHGGTFWYVGIRHHRWCNTQEGPGNKGWIGDYIYENDSKKKSNADVFAYDTAMAAANDCIAQGALPVVYTDKVVASSDEWFNDPNHRLAFARGTFEACKDAGMALIAGESAVYRYAVNARLPVMHTAIASGCVTGIVMPIKNLITGSRLCSGDRIVGIGSSGPHANGSSLLIQRILGDKDKNIPGLSSGFATRLPSGKSIGEAILTKTICYVRLVEQLLEEDIEIHAIMPGTGDGVAKLALAGADHAQLQYRIYAWPPVPEFFQFFLRELDIPLFDCLTTFNWGIGYYLFIPNREVERVLLCARESGYKAFNLGVVEKGPRGVVFPGPSGDIFLPPPDGPPR